MRLRTAQKPVILELMKYVREGGDGEGIKRLPI